MDTTKYSTKLEETIGCYMDDSDVLDDVLDALSEDVKIDILLYIARNHDIPVPKRD